MGGVSMHAVILAAGEGSRLNRKNSVPKAFLELSGKTLYERQLEALTPHVDAITVVLGYGSERVLERVTPERTIIVEHWDQYDNAESLRQALCDEMIRDDDILIMNGDVVVTGAVIDGLIAQHGAIAGAHSVVGALEPVAGDHTALQCESDGTVTEYGLIEGYRHAGVGILDRSHIERARAILWDHREGWYPVIYPALETKLVQIPPAHHLEINRPEDSNRAKERLPLPSLRSAEQGT